MLPLPTSIRFLCSIPLIKSPWYPYFSYNFFVQKNILLIQLPLRNFAVRKCNRRIRVLLYGWNENKIRHNRIESRVNGGMPGSQLLCATAFAVTLVNALIHCCSYHNISDQVSKSGLDHCCVRSCVLKQRSCSRPQRAYSQIYKETWRCEQQAGKTVFASVITGLETPQLMLGNQFSRDAVHLRHYQHESTLIMHLTWDLMLFYLFCFVFDLKSSVL